HPRHRPTAPHFYQHVQGELCATRRPHWCQEGTSGEICGLRKVTRARRLKIDISNTRHCQQISNFLAASSNAVVKLDAHKNMSRSTSVRDEHRPIICSPFCLTCPLVELPACYAGDSHSATSMNTRIVVTLLQ